MQNGEQALPEDVTALLELSEEELLTRLGYQIERVTPGVKPLTKAEARDHGRNWLQRNRQKLGDAICNDPRIIALRRKRAQDRIALAAAILDVIAALAGIVGPATVAVLLAKEGLDGLCGDVST